MLESEQINVIDRVLLHLSRFATESPPEEYPSESAQAGIAFAVGISRTHVPRAVKGLMKDGLIEELTARVKGHDRRMNVYVVTREGMRKADEFWRSAQGMLFSVMLEGNIAKMSGKEIEDLVGKRRTIAAISQMTDGIVVIDEHRRTPLRILDEAPSLGEFLGRDVELKAMDAFIESDRRVLVVLGNRGYGSTSLVRKFVETRDDLDVLWITLNVRSTVEELQLKVVSFGKRVSKDVEGLADALGVETALYVFDNYFSVDDQVVEFFSSMVETVDGAKMIMTARPEMPAYNWFYHKPQIDSGIVEELKIAGLDTESAKKLLGSANIEPDALKRVLGMTRCQPMALMMLREGDLEGMKKNTMFTAEEARYMLFLKEKKTG
jgi:DNA-binding MarR family transcriptional regulator